ncbi:Ca2+-modulated nonselective cation channel polycystin [Zymoseptoria tritici IPO323]|uniref:Ca2+-modulated nonselective cation channel polycystin n=1 Tax=Zymoseptoria tritici (strain CBS 115943 / IPO323) TaxID=336722 RepID=F9X623_ZYMTI|nr:Ca2+-modulated nonselective cation channel polycystin [Zymoseptoria tritici IPO323]EGP89606.1 Ca2+-modulated nonselective cation channel polycystin [Zymoseptoria tritici IPO323]
MKCQALSVVLACTVQAVWANPPPAYGNAPSPPTYGSKPPQYGSSPPQPYGVCKEYYSLIYYPPAQAFCQNNYPKPRQTSTVVTTSTVTVSQPYQGPPSHGPPGHGPPTPPSHGPPFAGPPAVCNAKREADPEVEPVAEAEAHLMNLRKRHYDLAKDFCDKCIKPKPPVTTTQTITKTETKKTTPPTYPTTTAVCQNALEQCGWDKKCCHGLSCKDFTVPAYGNDYTIYKCVPDVPPSTTKSTATGPSTTKSVYTTTPQSSTTKSTTQPVGTETENTKQSFDQRIDQFLWHSVYELDLSPWILFDQSIDRFIWKPVYELDFSPCDFFHVLVHDLNKYIFRVDLRVHYIQAGHYNFRLDQQDHWKYIAVHDKRDDQRFDHSNYVPDHLHQCLHDAGHIVLRKLKLGLHSPQYNFRHYASTSSATTPDTSCTSSQSTSATTSDKSTSSSRSMTDSDYVVNGDRNFYQDDRYSVANSKSTTSTGSSTDSTTSSSKSTTASTSASTTPYTTPSTSFSGSSTGSSSSQSSTSKMTTQSTTASDTPYTTASTTQSTTKGTSESTTPYTTPYTSPSTSYTTGSSTSSSSSTTASCKPKHDDCEWSSECCPDLECLPAEDVYGVPAYSKCQPSPSTSTSSSSSSTASTTGSTGKASSTTSSETESTTSKATTETKMSTTSAIGSSSSTTSATTTASCKPEPENCEHSDECCADLQCLPAKDVYGYPTYSKFHEDGRINDKFIRLPLLYRIRQRQAKKAVPLLQQLHRLPRLQDRPHQAPVPPLPLVSQSTRSANGAMIAAWAIHARLSTNLTAMESLPRSRQHDKIDEYYDLRNSTESTGTATTNTPSSTTSSACVTKDAECTLHEDCCAGYECSPSLYTKRDALGARNFVKTCQPVVTSTSTEVTSTTSTPTSTTSSRDVLDTRNFLKTCQPIVTTTSKDMTSTTATMTESTPTSTETAPPYCGTEHDKCYSDNDCCDTYECSLDSPWTSYRRNARRNTSGTCKPKVTTTTTSMDDHPTSTTTPSTSTGTPAPYCGKEHDACSSDKDCCNTYESVKLIFSTFNVFSDPCAVRCWKRVSNMTEQSGENNVKSAQKPAYQPNSQSRILQPLLQPRIKPRIPIPVMELHVIREHDSHLMPCKVHADAGMLAA